MCSGSKGSDSLFYSVMAQHHKIILISALLWVSFKFKFLHDFTLLGSAPEGISNIKPWCQAYLGFDAVKSILNYLKIPGRRMLIDSDSQPLC